MNIQQLQYILEIEQSGSINKAAQNLYISQPALSRVLKELEDEIGITIFLRNNTGVIATHQGKEFLLRAKRLNEQFVSFQEQYYDRGKSNILTLSVSSVHYAVVEHAFTNFYDKHKEHELQNISISETNTNEVLFNLYDGRYSLGFILISSDTREYFKHKADLYNLHWETLSVHSSYIQIGKQNPLSSREGVKIEELREYPHATMASSDVSSILSCSDVRGYDAKLSRKRIIVNDKSMLYEILTHTNAFYIGVNLAALSPGNGRICYVPIYDTDVTIEFVLLYLKSHNLTKTEAEFIEEIKALSV